MMMGTEKVLFSHYHSSTTFRAVWGHFVVSKAVSICLYPISF